MGGPRKQTEADKIAYHKQQMHTYRAIDRITHNIHFKPLIRGGEPYPAPIDENGNEIKI